MHLANLKQSGSRPAYPPTLKATFSSKSSILPIWKNTALNNKASWLEEWQRTDPSCIVYRVKEREVKVVALPPLQTSVRVLLKRRYRKYQDTDLFKFARSC